MARSLVVDPSREDRGVIRLGFVVADHATSHSTSTIRPVVLRERATPAIGTRWHLASTAPPEEPSIVKRRELYAAPWMSQALGVTRAPGEDAEARR